MKKITILLILFFAFNFSVQGQEYEQIINVTLGVGGSVQGSKVKTPAFYGSYEYFIDDNISIGGIVGYSTLSVETFGFGNSQEDNTSNIVAGGLANYYILNDDNFDVYFGTLLGYSSGLTGSFLYEFHGGARYQLTDSISLNSELGFGLSLLKVGVSFDL